MAISGTQSDVRNHLPGNPTVKDFGYYVHYICVIFRIEHSSGLHETKKLTQLYAWWIEIGFFKDHADLNILERRMEARRNKN